ncbi:DUF2515 family protein [Herbaspirillum huttiense]|uniref:DUF2515 family protein n=1 Tax=Herbaspirillum huttiense TaxID=863372 RepID=UPI002176C128|nr:hypothetical protein [Herbaspirillum huttiense]UWE15710.1 hypothetical protein NY669_21910 [Herbaspirillum huttiense]
MPDSPWQTISTTNTTEKSSKELHLDCNVMWSMIQQMSTERLCVKKGRHSGSFVFSSSDRARRIAATYAQIYLETDKYGDTNKKGRFQLAFTSACDTKDAQLKSVAPRETQLEKFSSRMAWITEAAKLFHSLMNNRLNYMEQELHAIAAWVEMDRSSDRPYIPEIIP